MGKRVYIILFVFILIVCITMVVSCRKRELQSPFQSEIPLDKTTITIAPASEVTETTEPVVIEQGEAKLGIMPANTSAAEKEEVPGALVAPTTEQIQAALKNANYYNGDVDGKIGPKSKKAITDFQIDNGLEADGKVGPKTWAKLRTYLEAKKE